jgi:prevent-host-death family protein
MKRISIQDLKARLSTAVAEAEAGSTFLITRHNEPVAQLSPAHPQHLHSGTQVGTGRLQPAVRRGTKGCYLTVLMEDRGNR